MTAYQADTVFVPVIPSFQGFGDALTRGTQQAAAQAGKTAGQSFSSAAGQGAAKHGNGLADFFFSPTLNAAATRGGGGTGRAFATGISRALVGSVSSRIGVALGDALSAKVSSKLSQSGLFSGFAKNAQKAGSSAGTAAGQKVATGAQKSASKINWGVLNNRKLAVVAIGAGVLFGRHLAKSAERQTRASFHPETLFSPLRLGALGAATAVAGVLGGALAKGGARLEAIDSARGKLTGLGHDAKQVDQIMTDALASVKGTAFGLDEAATVSASAVASGIKPGKELQGTLKLIADTATIGNSTLTDTGAIFTKVASSNKVYNDTLNQLGDQGIPIVELLGKRMHKSSDEVRDLASKGKIDFRTFKAALQDGLGGAALSSGNTFQGALKNVGAAVSRVGAGLLKGAFPQLKGVFGDVTKDLDKVTPAATRLGDKLGGVFSGVIQIAKSLSPVVSSVGRVAAGAFHPFVKSLSGGKDVLQGFADFLDTHQASLTGFFVEGGHVAIGFGKAVAGVVFGVIKGVQGINKAVAFVLQGVTSTFADMNRVIADSIRSFAPEQARALDASASKLDSMAAHSQVKAAEIDASLQGAADGIKNGLLPALNAADEGLTKVGNQEIAKAKLRDQAAAVAQAIKGIGTNADGSQIKLKRFSDISKLSAEQQAALKGRINDARYALGTQLSSLQAAGAGQKALTKAWREGKDRLYDEFRQMGLSKEAAHKLAAEYAGIKPKIQTKVTQPGMPKARSDTKDLGKRISDLQGRKVKITYSTNAASIAKQFKVRASAISNADSKPGVQGFGFARGGVLPGYTPGRDVHRFVSPTGGVLDLSGGEPVMRPEFGRVVGKGWVDAANAAARSGGVGGVRQFLGQGRQAFATGGVFRSISTPTTGTLGIPDFGVLTSRLATGIGANLGAAIGRRLDKLIGSGGGNTGKALSYAKAHAGHPYQFGTLWDCSGFISALHSIAKGEPPHRRYVTTSFVGDQANGFTRGKRSNFRVGVNPKPGKSGHMAGTINGTNVESRGGDGVVVGKRARGWDNSLFSWRGGLATGGFVGLGPVRGDLPFDLINRRGKHYDPTLRAAVERTPLRTALFDSGGMLQPGLTLAYNGTGRPERIRTEVQEKQLQQVAGPSRNVNLYAYGPDPREVARDLAERERIDQVMTQFQSRG